MAEDVMSNFPSVDESFDRLHRAGWSVGEIATAGAWVVSGTNGDVVQPYCLLSQKCLGLITRENTNLYSPPLMVRTESTTDLLHVVISSIQPLRSLLSQLGE